jgi:hypothetical protein
MGCNLVATWTEVTVDERMSGEKVLRLFGRLEPLHLLLASSRRPMRVLGPIVQIRLCQYSMLGSSWRRATP